MTGNRRHVVKRPDGQWAIVKPDSQRVCSLQDTQAQAISTEKEILFNSGGGECVIHGVNGKIRDADTVFPGNDPYPPHLKGR